MYTLTTFNRHVFHGIHMFVFFSGNAFLQLAVQQLYSLRP